MNRRHLWLGFLLPLLMIGCGSQPARFYVLESESSTVPAVSLPELVLGVGPVRLATYLERPQIVSRIRSSQLEVEEFDRWGGSFEANITWVMADYLAHRLGTQAVVTFPWERAVIPLYQVTVDIRRFDLLRDDRIFLDAQWRIMNEDGRRLLVIRTTGVEEPVLEGTLEGQIVARSRALARLSDDIATAIQTLMNRSSSTR